MGGNQINLFKYRYGEMDYCGYYDNGSYRWGGYVAWIQDEYGERVTKALTGYEYTNQYLPELG